ncbi:hypothetical protein G4V62_12715 [Bacillaceae bacterium SIJ1]|uniref:YczE/YyaS/YitT family protein n=1 Tax=Litoribacterium kuwaitense TaxID=1398745 RepID=UPI0013ED83C3|nr:YitT family protein [Litoribacterium kuwaitense]NGP45774.1 hypothetical protein [Litoribacterium kuwaitense]
MVLLGSALTAFGILMFLAGEQGVDPISTFLLGMVVHLPFSFGTCSQIFNVTVLGIVLFLDRKKVGLGSVLNAVSVGYFINLFQGMGVDSYFTVPSWVLVFLGPIVLGIGTAIYLYADLGAGALEGMMLYLSEKTMLSIKWIRMILDATLVFTGYLLGGMVGVGTVVGILLIGPTIEWTLRKLDTVKKSIRFS